MAYVPHFAADVFISYSHEDDFVWIERFYRDLKIALSRKLRARTQPTIFFDKYNLRAGRVLNQEIRDSLAATGFFIALVSPRYNTSDYSRHKELPEFLKHHPLSSGRLIQVQLDLSAALPIANALAVPFANSKGIFRPDSEEYADALRRVYEPIVSELDRLYANSKMVFLAWSGNSEIEEERERLKSEIEGRDMRVFPEAVAEYESDIRLRDALQQCTTSVHFFASELQSFDLRQWKMAVQLNKPCIVASKSATEERRGPAGSPAPIYLGYGNPTLSIANAIEQIIGIGHRDERNPGKSLARTPVFLSFNEDFDATLGLKLAKRIMSRGPFEVIVPPPGRSARFEELERAKAALLCRLRADTNWLAQEVQALNRIIVASHLFDVQRALFLPGSDGTAGLDILEGDAILRSEDELDIFLEQLRGQFYDWSGTTEKPLSRAQTF